MRTFFRTLGPISISFLLLSGCTTARAQESAPPATSPADAAAMVPAQEAGPFDGTLKQDSPIDHVLLALQKRGEGLKTLVFSVKMTESSAGLGGGTTRIGRFWMQTQPDGSTRLRVMFDKRKVGQKLFDTKKEYVLDGQNLIERDYEARKEVTRQVLKPGEKLNILKLGEGPFPLPIGQEPAEVKRQFDVQLLKADDKTPANTLPVRLTPKPETKLARKFDEINVWIDLTTHMPTRIEAWSGNRATKQTTELSDVVFNQDVKPADVLPEQVNMSDWNRINEQMN